MEAMEAQKGRQAGRRRALGLPRAYPGYWAAAGVGEYHGRKKRGLTFLRVVSKCNRRNSAVQEYSRILPSQLRQKDPRSRASSMPDLGHCSRICMVEHLIGGI